MKVLRSIPKCLAFIAITLSCNAFASDAFTANVQAQPTTKHDGQHDFDFEIGTYKIHLKRLLHPLTGSTIWVEFDGISYTQKIWNGRGNIEQFETDSPAGHIEGLTLRLYNPDTQDWRLYWANSKDGIMVVPQIGRFRDGQGEFYAQDTLNGKTILVRFIWSNTNTDTPHFEQSFSEDWGKTWEVNWITDQTRIGEESFNAQAETIIPKLDMQDRGQHEFDFEIGSWKGHLKRLQKPLTGSTNWVEYDGTSVVKKLWNGRANFGELEVTGPSGPIEGITVRLYNPHEHQWRLYWANSRDGILTTPPTIGQFANGRGEFFDQEDLGEKAIFVRFVFSDVSSASFHTEQSFSIDAGKNWEPNWIADFSREK